MMNSNDNVRDLWMTVREVSYLSCILPKLAPDTLFTPSPLERVTVVNSGVAEVQLDAFTTHSSTLIHLDLSHNLLVTLPEAMVNLTRLEILDLSSNKISHLSEKTLLNFPRLRQLHLNYNRLGEMWIGPHLGLSASVLNLEVVKDTITDLSLSHNALSAIPQQFTRAFTRLINLDLSSNNISEVLVGALSNMAQLQHLDLSNNLIHSIMPQALSTTLLHLNLAGNPWDCNCDSLWLLKSYYQNASNTMPTTPTIAMPLCSFPLHLRHRKLTTLTELELCPHRALEVESQVFYVGDDVDGVLRDALSSLHLVNVTALNHQALLVSWRVDGTFYSSLTPLSDPLSWAISLQETMQGHRDAKVTKMRLALYKENSNWKPSNSSFTEVLQGLKPETQYTLCLAPIQDHYLFIHPDECRHVTTPKRSLHALISTTTTTTPKELVSMPLVSTENYSVKTEQVSIMKEARRVNLSWNVTVFPYQMLDILDKKEALLRPLGWKITYRRLGDENETEIVLVSQGGEPLQNFTNHYSVEGLEPSMGYIFCFRSLSDQEVSVSLTGNMEEVNKMSPQSHSFISLNPELMVLAIQGGSIQSHVNRQLADTNSNKNKSPLLSEIPESYSPDLPGKVFQSQRTKPAFPSKTRISPFQSQGSSSIFPPQFTTEAFPSKGITTALSLQGITTALPPQETIVTLQLHGTTTTLPLQGTTAALPSQRTTGTFPPQGHPIGLPSKEVHSESPLNIPDSAYLQNLPSLPNISLPGSNKRISLNVPPVLNLPIFHRPAHRPRSQSLPNFVFTSTGERIILPSTSSGPTHFNLPAVIGPSINIRSSIPTNTTSLMSAAHNSSQRFIYEFGNIPPENNKQKFTYDFNKDNSSTSKPQVNVHETRRKRSTENNSNSHHKMTLESGAMQYCQEVVTPDENDIHVMIPVAIASTVSSLVTLALVIIFCCCCPRKCPHKKKGWSGKPSYTLRKTGTISAPTPVTVYSGNNSILTGSVISEGNGNLKTALPSMKSNITASGPTDLGLESNNNLMKSRCSLSVTSSFGYLVPLQIPGGSVHDPEEMLRNVQPNSKAYQSSVIDHLLKQHKDLQEFHPGYDIPPTSSNKTLFGYDYPHPTPVNPIGAYSQNHKPVVLNKLQDSLLTGSDSHYNSSIENGQNSEARHSKINLNIPFIQKSSDLYKNNELNKSPDSNKSVEYNYIIPENMGNKPLTYTKNSLSKSRCKSGLSETPTEEFIPEDFSSLGSQDCSDHPLSSEHLSYSDPVIAEENFNTQGSEVLKKSVPVQLSLLINDHKTTLPRLLKKEPSKTTSLSPIHPLSPKRINISMKKNDGNSNFPSSEDDIDKQQYIRPTHQEKYFAWTNKCPKIPSLGEVVLTGGTLIEVPEGYVVPKSPKPRYSVTLLVPEQAEKL
ncbi:uncharacterized protein [Cherax quadricarinatus]